MRLRKRRRSVTHRSRRWWHIIVGNVWRNSVRHNRRHFISRQRQPSVTTSLSRNPGQLRLYFFQLRRTDLIQFQPGVTLLRNFGELVPRICKLLPILLYDLKACIGNNLRATSSYRTVGTRALVNSLSDTTKRTIEFSNYI